MDESDYAHPPFVLPRYERAAIAHDRACRAMEGTKGEARRMAAALVVYWARQMERAA